MSALDPADMRRLKASLALLASSSDGEKLAAINAAQRLLKKGGLGFADLEPAAPQSAWSSFDPKAERRARYPGFAGPPERATLTRPQQREAMRLQCAPCAWSVWEAKYLASIASQRSELTDKQRRRLDECLRKADAWRGRTAA